MHEVRLKVPDMSCGHCTAAVRRAIEVLPEIEEVDISLETKIVKIISHSLLDSSALMAAIQKAGYTPEAMD